MHGREGSRRQRYVFAVSDATGKTCELLARAALAQFESATTSLEVVPHVRTAQQIHKLFQRAAKVNGVIIYTMVCAEFRQLMTRLGRLNGVPTVDVLGPVLTRFSDLLEISPLAEPGLFRELDREYFDRIEAIDFTIRHDDGMALASLEQAELVLVGVSRTSKTPLCTYLSYRGWRAANVPLVLDEPLPPELLAVDPLRVVALTINPGRLEAIRAERQRKLGTSAPSDYSDLDHIRREVIYAQRIFEERGWPVVDVTYKSIEESATEVMRIAYSQLGLRKGSIADGG